jgi:uracil-DNA glycosylase|tara:strand:- start:2 stop:721 length:720 start_codon:yes stop_codon:yes gene_type:complete
MSKKSLDQSMSYKEELINLIESDFIFSKKPINRFKIKEVNIEKKSLNKIEQINQLKKLINSIQNCNLKNNSKDLVLGDGNLDSPIMIIGEAPGPEEEKTNKTFQGESGALLEKMLSAINIKKENVYSSYAINFRPPDDRKPTSQEIKRYSIFLKEHISIIDPKIIILFGSTAMESVTHSNERISNERGKWKEIILKNKTYPIMVTFNPSYLIRFPENKKFSWEDLKKIKQKMLDLKIKI